MRFGLVGTGYWADTVHAAALAAHPDVELVGIWGRDAAKAATVAARHGTIGVASFDDLLEMADAIAFAVPPDTQGEMAKQAANAGRHILLEKPVALSVEAAEEVLAAVRRTGVRSLVFFTQRFGEPTASWLRDTIAPSEWHGGTITMMAPVLASGPFSNSPWRHEHGALWDGGPHALSTLIAGLGPVREVSAQRGHGDTIHLSLAHEKGGVSSITTSFTVTSASTRVEMLFWGPDGVANAPSENREPPESAFSHAITELVAAVKTGAPIAADVELGVEIVRIIAAAERFVDRPSEHRGERP